MGSPLVPGNPNLNAPPPSPQQGPPIVPAAPTSGPMPGGQQPSEEDGLKGIVRLGAEIDRGITALAQAFPQAAQEFRQAKQLIQSGLRKALADSPAQSLASSPTEAGFQFPGSMGGSIGT